MKYSIPFFGEQHNEIVEQILSSKPIDDILTYNTMYKMIIAESFKRCIVIIDNTWFVWLRDVQFNYRDGKVLLPYFPLIQLFHIDRTLELKLLLI